MDEELPTRQRNENYYLRWGKVLSGVPQGSVLAPIMFQMNSNDVLEGLSSYINIFPDDAKLLRVTRT